MRAISVISLDFNGPSWTYAHVFGPTQWNVAGVSVPVAHIAESRLQPIDQLNFSSTVLDMGCCKFGWSASIPTKER